MIFDFDSCVFLALTCFLFAVMIREIQERRRMLQHLDCCRESWEEGWNPTLREASGLKNVVSLRTVADPNTTADPLQRIHPVAGERVRRGLLRAFFDRLNYRPEIRFAQPDGARRRFPLRPKFLKPSSSEPAHLTGINADMTARRQAEVEMATLAHIVHSSENAIFTLSLEGKILSWNPRAEALYGYGSGEAVGRPFSLLIPPERADEMSAMLKQLACGRALHNVNTEHLRRNDQRMPVVLAASPVRDRCGSIVSFSVIAGDTTERQRAEMALHEAEKLSAVGRMAATIAHEINNPIDSILNSLYLLEQQSLPPEASTYLAIANREALRAADVVRQTLGLVRESAAPTRVKVSEILDDVLSLCQGKILNNSVHVVRRYDVPGELIGFPGVLRQIFANLVINAVEAMGHGGRLSLHIARAHGGESTQNCVGVFIADTGPGINPEHQKRIFEPLFTTKGEKGTGLGLWVTRGLVARHAGSTRLRSSTQPGRSGTCFAVFLPDAYTSGSAQYSEAQAA